MGRAAGGNFMVGGIVVGIIGLVLYSASIPGTNGACVSLIITLLGGLFLIVGIAFWAIQKLAAQPPRTDAGDKPPPS